ncbi:hypothetical protein XCY_002995 [Xanthomonas euroxanthea]|uniref:hypothetical protein n=1 Tax=Xanthomonas euroxanthea TaxID=2259622 RepID=UPI00161AC6BF|nr:hypothetical protein [Xanthomonas euroxanthea]MBB3814506.1 hypothetical protein [Xanthomonas euroxanthea]CAG2093663.1 hypothetical protein XCY_002995 [Xanthomonas euroxanthea]
MTQPADAGDDDPVSRLGVGHFEPLVDRHTCAKNGSDLNDFLEGKRWSEAKRRHLKAPFEFNQFSVARALSSRLHAMHLDAQDPTSETNGK